MTLNKHGKALLTFSSMLVGFLLIVLIKANASAPTSSAEVTYQNLSKVEQENQQLEADNAQLREELAELNRATETSQAVLEQLERAQINAGLKAMTGPGVRIVLDDSKNLPKGNEDINLYMIHEGDIRQIVNYLWNGGAEAIAINGQRVTTHTAIFCNGSNIQINGYLKYPPYVIEAIGDPTNLQGAFQFFWKWNQFTGSKTEVKIEVVESLIIPAGKQPTYKYAEPAKEGS